MKDPSMTAVNIVRKTSASRQRLSKPKHPQEKQTLVRQHARRTAEKSEIIFRELSKHSLAGVYLVQKDGLFRYVNARWAQIFGYKVEEVVDILRVEDLVVPEDLALVKQSLSKRVSGELPTHHYEFRIVTKDKDVRHVEVYSSYTEYEGRPAIIGTLQDVTDRKRAEQALKESENKYRLLADNTADVIFTFGLDMKYRYVSPSVIRIRGFSPDEVIGQLISQSVTAESLEAMNKVIREELWLEKTGTANPSRTRILELEMLCKDGSTVWVEVKASAVRDSDGDLGEIIGIGRDITERKMAEEALRTSELRISQAMELAHVVYWEYDPLENTLIFNDPFYALYGTTAEREGGYRMTREEYAKRFIHPDDEPRVSETAEQLNAMYGYRPIPDIEHRIVRRDGEVRYVAVRASAIRDDSGRIIKKYGVTQDITARKQAETRLSESEERYRTVFENTGTATIIVEDDTTISLCNTEFERLSGYTKNEMEGKKTWTEFAVKEDLGRMLSSHYLRREAPYATPRQYGFQFVTRTGEIRDMYLVIDMIPGTKKSVASLVDITELKRAEQEKARLETQLHQAQKMEAIGTLAGGIAHDFNNILTALIGYATLLQIEIKHGVSRGHVDQILAASQKAADLVRNLLAFSRQQSIRLEPVSLHAIVKETEKLLKRLLTEDIVVKTLLADNDIVIMADRTQVDQILFNLATNARDAMPRGGAFTVETKTVDLDVEFQRLHGYGKPGQYALLSISDTGVGMDEITRERIFDPFFTTKEAGKGTGLGLSTVYGIVKQHDGYITVYSEPHMGTTFHIYLPMARGAPQEKRPEPVPVKGGDEIILIGEDNEAVRELMDKALTQYGYATIKAVDGQDVVEQFKAADRIDLLILDSVMPKKSGREAYNEILTLKPDIKVIFTSGHTKDVVLDRGLQEGEFSFLQKPISPLALLQKIRDVLDDGQKEEKAIFEGFPP
ncbi:MAG TPA: PAS domain S-box protein [Syntrophorhabdaceae bacterium]|nr:PAS domain S-box protein [Syntrophorhabdaceae bacterium]